MRNLKQLSCHRHTVVNSFEPSKLSQNCRGQIGSWDFFKNINTDVFLQHLNTCIDTAVHWIRSMKIRITCVALQPRNTRIKLSWEENIRCSSKRRNTHALFRFNCLRPAQFTTFFTVYIQPSVNIESLSGLKNMFWFEAKRYLLGFGTVLLISFWKAASSSQWLKKPSTKRLVSRGSFLNFLSRNRRSAAGSSLGEEKKSWKI